MLTITATLAELERALVDDQSALAAILRDHAQQCPCAEGPAAATRLTPPPPDRMARVRAGGPPADGDPRGGAPRRPADCGRHQHERGRSHRRTHRRPGGAWLRRRRQARAAALPETEVRRLEELCAAYERARAEAETVLADPEVRAAADAPPPDVAALKEAAAAAQTALLHAKDAETLARRTLAAVARLRDELVRQCEALVPTQPGTRCCASWPTPSPARAATTRCACGSPRSSWLPVWRRWRPWPTSGWRSWAMAATGSSTPTAWPHAVPAAAWA